jgi:hypothetical protein
MVHKNQSQTAVALVVMNINAISEGREQPIRPPLTKPTIADYVWRYMTGQLPSVEDRQNEVGVP